MHAEPMKFNDALVAVLVASISPTKFHGVLQGGLPMIDVILTTLSVIATGAAALVAMWLVVRLRYVWLGEAAKVVHSTSALRRAGAR